MMQDLRKKTVPIMILVAVAFVGLMVFQWGMDISGRSSGAQNGELGKVNGDPVTYTSYQTALQQLTEQARQQAGGHLSSEQTRQLEDEAFNQIVNRLLVQQELNRRGITVSDAEIRQAALLMPPPEVRSQEIFQTNGQFDPTKWQKFLSSPQANEQLLMQLEQYYRASIPEQKLMQQVTAGSWVTDATLWRIWQDRNETATVDYVALDLSKLASSTPEVSDAEVKAYYDAHQDEFKRSASATFDVAVLSKAPTAADTLSSYQRALEVRQEVVNGADFATVAKRESADQGTKDQGGELGTFGHGQMVASFDSAAFSLPVGEISQPVLSPFGYHIIQVEERKDDQVKARHILIPVERTDSAADALYARADSLETLGGKIGLQRAANAVNGSVRRGVQVTEETPVVPGIGPMTDAIRWARDQAKADDAAKEKVSELFETDQAFYMVSFKGYTPAGEAPLADVGPQIRRELILKKKQDAARKVGQEMVAAVRSGKSLEQVAKAHGLEVQSAGPFTRLQPNPAFGQATAAVGASFGTPVGKVSDVVQTPSGLFIVKPTARTQADRKAFETAKEQMRQMVMMQMQQQQVQQFLQALRQQAKIVDNRAEVLQS